MAVPSSSTRYLWKLPSQRKGDDRTAVSLCRSEERNARALGGAIKGYGLPSRSPCPIRLHAARAAPEKRTGGSGASALRHVSDYRLAFFRRGAQTRRLGAARFFSSHSMPSRTRS